MRTRMSGKGEDSSRRRAVGAAAATDPWLGKG